VQNVPNYVSTRLAAEELQIPFQFSTKVMQQLAANGLVISRRGATGGIMLARHAEEISLLDIIAAIDGLDLFQQCILGLPGCGQAKPCPMHDEWAAQREELREYFKNTSLEDVAVSIRLFSHRISAENFTKEILHI
jgi:Rrf2 family protein